MKKLTFSFNGKVKDLLEAIEWEQDMEEQRIEEQEFNELGFCDLYGYCSESCKYYHTRNCH